MRRVLKYRVQPILAFTSPWRQSLSVKRGEYDADYAVYRTSATLLIPVQSLRANLHTLDGIVRIPLHLSPHFAFVMNAIGKPGFSRLDYLQYWRLRHPASDPEDHAERFAELIEQICCHLDSAPSVELLVLLHRLRPRTATIVDGLHRAAILSALGVDWAKCALSAGRLS